MAKHYHLLNNLSKWILPFVVEMFKCKAYLDVDQGLVDSRLAAPSNLAKWCLPGNWQKVNVQPLSKT